MREIAVNIIMISLAVTLLVYFLAIAVCGSLTAIEPNRGILGFEIFIVVTIIGFGVSNLIDLSKGK